MSYIPGNNTFLKAAFEPASVWDEAAGSMTLPSGTEFAFGQGVDSSISNSNNKMRIYGVGDRNASATVAQQYSGSITINGAVNNFYWLLGALGTVTDGGTGPSSWTHTYTEADVLPTFAAYRRAQFATEKNRIVQGCVVNSCRISSAINETVKFSLECPFRYSKIDSSAQTNVVDTQKPYTFAGGTIEIPDGTTIASIQNIELTINNSAELVYGVGSRFAQGFAAKNREYNFSFTAAIENYDLLSKFYDGSTGLEPGTSDGEMATMTLTFVNSDGHQAVITLADFHFNEETESHMANEVVKEDITGWANSLTSIVYTNATEAAPIAA